MVLFDDRTSKLSIAACCVRAYALYRKKNKRRAFESNAKTEYQNSSAFLASKVV